MGGFYRKEGVGQPTYWQKRRLFGARSLSLRGQSRGSCPANYPISLCGLAMEMTSLVVARKVLIDWARLLLCFNGIF